MKEREGYLDFLDLYDKPDAKVLAFMQEHGVLKFEGETPAMIQQEAQKMHLVIQLWRIVEECTDKAVGFVPDKIWARKSEVSDLVRELLSLWPSIAPHLTTLRFHKEDPPCPAPPLPFQLSTARMGVLDITDPGFGLDILDNKSRSFLVSLFGDNYRRDMLKPEQEAAIYEEVVLPDMWCLFNDVLSRIRLKVVRDTPLEESPFMLSANKTHRFELKEGCLLDRLWYDMINDTITNGAVPRRCECDKCNKLFIPSRPAQIYCSNVGLNNCQSAAKQHRFSAKRAEEKGQPLRDTPGRPPKKKPAE